eukprot:4058412-Prymnesium_polylepis.1
MPSLARPSGRARGYAKPSYRIYSEYKSKGKGSNSTPTALPTSTTPLGSFPSKLVQLYAYSTLEYGRCWTGLRRGCLPD